MKKISGITGRIAFAVKARLFGVKCAGRVNCFGQVHLLRHPGSEISFGKNVQIISKSYRATAFGAQSPVTKDIPANVIAAGSPAKVLRILTENDIVK